MDSTISQALLPVSFEPETAELLTLTWGLLAGASMKFCDDLIDIYNQKKGLWLLFGKTVLIISSAFIILDPNIYTILYLTLLCSLVLLLYPSQVFDNKFWIVYCLAVILTGFARTIWIGTFSLDAFIPYFILCFIPSIALYFQERHLRLRLSEVGFGKMLFRFLFGVVFTLIVFLVAGTIALRDLVAQYHADTSEILVPFRSYCLFLFGYYCVSVSNQVYVLYFKDGADRRSTPGQDKQNPQVSLENKSKVT